MAQWNKQGGLTCSKCEEFDLVAQGLEDCETCKKPRTLEANNIIFELYSFAPLLPIAMSELVLLDIKAVEFLFKVYGIPHNEQRSILERMTIYHNSLYSKDKVNIKEEGKEM